LGHTTRRHKDSDNPNANINPKMTLTLTPNPNLPNRTNPNRYSMPSVCAQ